MRSVQRIFTKMAREIMVVVKEGGANPASNSRLADVIAKAKAANVPNDNIERAIKKADGSGDGKNYEHNIYEGYGPGGVAVVVECLTDNKNRTAGDLRHYFDKFGGNLGTSGSVLWQFKQCGVIVIAKAELTRTPDDGCAGRRARTDFNAEDEMYEIITSPENFSAVRSALEAAGYVFETAEITRVAENYVSLTDENDIKFMNLLLDALEDNDDVQNVAHNWDE